MASFSFFFFVIIIFIIIFLTSFTLKCFIVRLERLTFSLDAFNAHISLFSLKRLLRLKLTADLKSNPKLPVSFSMEEIYTAIAKDTGRMGGSLYRSRKDLTPSAVFHLYKSRLRLGMVYCCYTWFGVFQSSLPSLETSV